MTVRVTSKQNYFWTIFREAPGKLVVHGLEVLYSGCWLQKKMNSKHFTDITPVRSCFTYRMFSKYVSKKPM